MKRPKNSYYVRNAVTYYTKALDEQCGDTPLEATCYSNRAQAHLLLGRMGIEMQHEFRAFATSS